jgi:hypothetical protein
MEAIVEEIQDKQLLEIPYIYHLKLNTVFMGCGRGDGWLKHDPKLETVTLTLRARD